jgi:DNA-directed RNA polymerase sigma subunit (sigma70/sigma32)
MKSEIRRVYHEQLARLWNEDREYLRVLSPCEVLVLELRSGSAEIKKKTLKEIGERMGLTKQRVGQIEREGLRKVLRAKRGPLAMVCES